MADAAQPMLPLRAGTVVEVPWPRAGNVAHIHLMADLGGDSQHIPHHRLPLRTVGANAAAIDQARDQMGDFVGDDLAEKLARIFQHQRVVEAQADFLLAPLANKHGLPRAGASQVEANLWDWEMAAKMVASQSQAAGGAFHNLLPQVLRRL